MTFLRFTIAALVLFAAFLLRRKCLRASVSDHLKFAVLGITGVTSCYFFYFQGLHLSTAFNAGLIEATIPLTTLAFAVLSSRERLRTHRAVGFALAYFGIVIVVTEGERQRFVAMRLSRGDLMLLASTVCFGIYNVLAREFRSALPEVSRIG